MAFSLAFTTGVSDFGVDLAIDRGHGKPTAPAVFLSGNGPLVQVLQYELRDAGGGGRPRDTGRDRRHAA